MLFQRDESLSDYRRSTEYLNSKGVGATKQRLSLQGRLYVDCEICSKNLGGFYCSREIGEASGNMRSGFDNIKFNAVDNAKVKHASRDKGRSGAVLKKIFDYWIVYFNDADARISRKRVYYKPKKKGVRGQYRMITRFKGRIICNDPFSTRPKKLFVDDFDLKKR